MLVHRKIVKINEQLCNGCGQCIPKCAEGALQIVNGKAKIIKDVYCDGLGACIGECPQDAITIIERDAEAFDPKAVEEHLKTQETTKLIDSKPQWPIKFNLIPSKAPFFQNADLLVTADCVPATLSNFHSELSNGKKILIGCPKFEDAKFYAEKLSEILKQNQIDSITVATMEVPCCSALKWVVKIAVENSGKQIPIKEKVITIGGEIQ